MTKMSAVHVAIGAAILVGVLSGCSTSDGFSVFDREPTADDHLPSDFDSIDTTEFDLDTVRYSGTHDGVDFYLIRQKFSDPTPTPTPCLAIASGTSSAIACGGSDGGVTAGGPGYEAQLVEEPAQDAQGWVAISDNVRVRAEH